ncbi:YafY family protein [Bradyrhizobium prioriisuperbiae]|uniref:helix-turn-helix transcriptional regulator n=1 Tax=Bradyrhizobium prioriisuperbiae TaxID=2854389 RepID=UPI0028EFE337|nr:YafY family protein [Bradyrhizobium prioritasuperba]
MRASRLLSILITLQARGRVTAQALADDCEVSLRTIYRDIDALSAAGVPVYSDRGSTGGYRLLDGYRVRLNGLSAQEADALFLSGLSGPAAALGLGAVLTAAQLKITAALPPELRPAAERMRARFHLDAPGWFHAAEQPASLQQIATAVWEERLVQIRYRSWKAEKHRQVAPLGIVLKSGAWYMVGAVQESVQGKPRTYRINRIRDIAVLDERFARPAEFSLESYWSDATRRLEDELHPRRARVRISPTGMKLLEHLTSPFAVSRMEISEPDSEGYRIVTLPIGASDWHASSDILRFGIEAEVLEPPELRTKMREIAKELRQRYR